MNTCNKHPNKLFRNKKCLSNHLRWCEGKMEKAREGLIKNYKCSLKTSIKMSASKIKEKNPQWKGNKVGYNALHSWVKIRLPKTVLCEFCKKNPAYDLANKGIYNRDLINWEWLCRKCHMTNDGRLEKLHQKRKLNVS